MLTPPSLLVLHSFRRRGTKEAITLVDYNPGLEITTLENEPLKHITEQYRELFMKMNARILDLDKRVQALEGKK
jgi:hypothetical protein